VWAKNALAMLSIGDVVMRIVAPQEHERPWVVGPAWLSRANGIGWLAKNPPTRDLLVQRSLGQTYGSPSYSKGAPETKA
jgi:hypothetical protein